jgi:hypothetical protein
MSKRNIDLQRVWIEVAEIGFGFDLYVCWARNFASPVGFVWGVPSLLDDGRVSFDVFGSYVIPHARRQGVRTRLNLEILKTCATITSNNGSKAGGADFMRAFGYCFKEDEGTWVFVKPRTETRKAAAK